MAQGVETKATPTLDHASLADRSNGLARKSEPDVCTAFALGWELAAIHEFDRRDGRAREAPPPRRLPTVEMLPAGVRLEVSLQLVESKLGKLAGCFPNGQRAFDPSISGLRQAIRRRSALKPDAAIEALHAEFLVALATAGPKLGPAYALGHELAEVTLWPRTESEFDDAFGTRAIAIKDRLADLASSLPPHAGRAVVLSLRAWEKWAAEPKLGRQSLVWEKTGEAVTTALSRQGTLWRDLLAGDKLGQDMLDTHHYVQAASSLFGRMFRTAVTFARAAWWLLLIFAALLLGGIALIVFAGVNFAGGVLAVLGALGITGGSARARLGGIADNLQSELWGAELDRAIAGAVLTGPSDWGVEIGDVDVPASGAEQVAAANIATLQKLRKAVSKRSRRRIKGLLTDDVEFAPGPSSIPQKGKKDVLAWLGNDLHTGPIVAEAQAIDVIRQGILVSDLEAFGAAVWRVREGKVRRWKWFATLNQARADAHRLVDPDEVGDQPQPSV